MKNTVGKRYTMGFMIYCRNYRLVCTHTCHRYGFGRYRYSVGNPNPQITRAKPYSLGMMG